ncbi:hypothetical protein Ancab_001805 [Ancistrocladus abbreviatus]
MTMNPGDQRLLLSLFFVLFAVSHADIGTAAHYSPPYLPTACYGSDPSQFPSNNLFAAAGDGIWDNGAACGRQYLVRCISAAEPKACFFGDIRVKIVDQVASAVSPPSTGGATMVLSTTAYGAIARLSVTSIDIEFTEI